MIVTGQQQVLVLSVVMTVRIRYIIEQNSYGVEQSLLKACQRDETDRNNQEVDEM